MNRRKWTFVLVTLVLLGGSLGVSGNGGGDAEADRGTNRKGAKSSFLTKGLGKTSLPSAVKNFEFCVPPDEEMLECMLPRPGMTMIYPYMQRMVSHVSAGGTQLTGSDTESQSETDSDASSDSPARAGGLDQDPDAEALPNEITDEPDSEGRARAASKTYVRVAVRDMEGKVQVFTIGEFYPDLKSSSPVMSYRIMGRSKVSYEKFGEAVLAVMSTLRIPDDFVTFPVFECGTQWADAVGVMGKKQSRPENEDKYQGTDAKDATKWCMVEDETMAKCYLKYYEYVMETSGYSEPMSMISRTPTVDEFMYSSIAHHTFNRIPSLVFKGGSYHARTLSTRTEEASSFDDIVLFVGRSLDAPQQPAGLPDYNCGGRRFYATLKEEYFERAEEKRGASVLDLADHGREEPEEDVAWVLPPSWKAALRGLTMAAVLELEEGGNEADKKNDMKLKDVDPAMRMKCEQFFEARGIPVQMGTDMGVDFDTVKGNGNAKKAMYDNVITPYIMQNSDQPRNVLQYGPPGTGKSLLAKALVSELTRAADGLGRTDGVTYLPVTVSTFESMWKGQSQENVRTLFECARAYSPSVVFIDECDSLFASRNRGGANQEYSSKVKGEFLVQMDGSFKAKKGDLVVIVAATNRPQDLDSAFRRRLPVNVFVGLPNKEARESIIDAKLGQYMPADYKTAEWWNPLLEATKGYSGSDLQSFCKEVLTDAETKSLSGYMTSLPRSIQEKIDSNPELARKVAKFGPFSVLLDLNLSAEQMAEYVSSAKSNLKTSTKVATGLRMNDAKLITKAIGTIKRSVTKADMVELFNYMTNLGGIALNDVPMSYRNARARSSAPTISVDDVIVDSPPSVEPRSRRPEMTPEDFWVKAVNDRPKWVNCDHE